MNINTVYLREQGSVIKKSGGRLQVVSGDEKLANLPARFLKRILIFGNVQISTQAVAMLLDNGTDVSYLTTRSRLRGMLVGSASKNIYVRIAQHQCWQDPHFRIQFAREVVEGKIYNMLEMVRYYRRLRKEIDVSQVKDALTRSLESAQDMQSTGELLGVEGSATAKYFKIFSLMIDDRFKFPGRRKRPAPDPVNALLSLGYAMITNELTSLLQAHSLDPYLGFLHGIKYGRPSLALDMVEYYRQPLVDRFTLSLLNRQIFKERDFYQHPEGGIFLKPDAFKEYLKRYERHFTERKKGEMSWQGKMQSRIRELEKRLLAQKAR